MKIENRVKTWNLSADEDLSKTVAKDSVDWQGRW